MQRRSAAELHAREREVQAAYASWQAMRASAERLAPAAQKTARARALGEAGAAAALLARRRQADAAELVAESARTDAFEAQRKLALDARALWRFEVFDALR